MTQTIRVLVVDDHTVVRKGYLYMLKAFADLELVGEAGTGMEAIQLCDELKPDVILMDMMMPELNGIEATRTITGKYPETRVIALTSYERDNELVQQALEAGAISFLYKNTAIDELAEAIRSAAKGRSYLSPDATRNLIQAKTKSPTPDFNLTDRELEVLRHLVGGLTNVEIAEKLILSPATVKFHVSSLLGKLHASTRTEAVSIALQHKLLDD